MDGFGTDTRVMLEQYGITLTKAMGQNFLTDKNIPAKLVRLSGLDRSYGVLEVGPGLGALTRELCAVAGRVTSVELDKRLIEPLKNSLDGLDNVQLVQGDILKLDIVALLREKMPGLRYAAAANLPYNITTPVLTAFIDSGMFDTVTVMVQREVARRICSKPGGSEYGAFTVYANYHTEPEILFDVPPECFIPRPKVVSTVLTMKARKKALEEASEAFFFRVVRASFAQRRKTLVNALCAVFGDRLGKALLTDVIRSCGYDERIRGETLGIPEFIAISEKLRGLYQTS